MSVDDATTLLAGAPTALAPTGEPPADYPRTHTPDPFTDRPFAPTFAERRNAFLAFVSANPAPEHTAGVFHELARLAAGATPYVGVFDGALNFIEGRHDCADFVLHGILRLLYQFPDDTRLPLSFWKRARRVVLGFKYWPDEPGIDSLCTWTENHQILFASAAFLAGGLYPDAVFTNDGVTGEEKRATARRRIVRWLDLRFRSGFSEWLSNIYYDEDLAPLLNLVDFAADDEIASRAAGVVDLLLLDIALNSFRGVFGCSHGRSYDRAKKWAAREATSPTAKLAFGLGSFGDGNLSAPCLALSERYQVPAVLDAIANDADREVMENRQRLGIRLAEAERWGLGFQDYEDGMIFLSLEAYIHPLTAGLTMRMFDAFNWWENGFFSDLKARRGLINLLRATRLLQPFARLLQYDLSRNLREEVHVTTYRTPDYMLSAAQDWRPGTGGDQQHLWQATLGPDAVCFTTHPGTPGGETPDHWTGSATLPRVAQVENVAIAIYHIDSRPALYVSNRNLYTHAWLPRDHFDEVREEAGWIFARKNDGFLALRSQQPTHWQSAAGEDQGRELIAPGRDNVWICELGRRARDGSFDEFIAKIAAAAVDFGHRSVAYRSPSQGVLELGWRGPLRQNGSPRSVGAHPRYDNPYVQAPFPPEEVTVRHGGHSLELRRADGGRAASGFLT